MAEYHPLPMPERPSEPEPIDMAIYNFEVACVNYHNNKRKLLEDTLSKTEKERLAAAQKRDWEHIQRRKAALCIHARAKEDLEAYRAANKKKTTQELLTEKHDRAKDRLGRKLTANGEIQPSPKHAAHHIIPGKGRYLLELVIRARMNLHSHGIGINDPDNGVWLVHNKTNADLWKTEASSSDKPRHWATPEAPVHLTIHGKNYERWIGTTFRARNLPEDVFRERLSTIKLRMSDGTYPPIIEEPVDEEFDGIA